MASDNGPFPATWETSDIRMAFFGGGDSFNPLILSWRKLDSLATTDKAVKLGCPQDHLSKGNKGAINKMEQYEEAGPLEPFTVYKCSGRCQAYIF